MSNTLWQRCLGLLRERFSQQDFNACIRPLEVEEKDNLLILLAPNRFVVNWIQEEFLNTIKSIVSELSVNKSLQVIVKIGSNRRPLVEEIETNDNNSQQSVDKVVDKEISSWRSNLNRVYVFDNFVEGNSNQIALAAAKQISQNPGGAYNPLFLYGGVGLGKTHLMHAVGNEALAIKGNHLKVLYLHSERFVAEMVKSLQTNTINRFKEFYRSIDILLIDDIQFLAGKDRSQEEFFHTFNSLIESHKQIILTCDRYPKEVSGLEERLKSRFGWGLTVAVEPPELETRVAILMNKAESQVNLPYEVAFFIAKRIRSNIRELEGALKRVIASAQFTGQAITVDFAKKALKDLLSLQDRLVTLENIQKTVAGYYKIKLADLLSKRRNRSYARPRQIAMALAKELTNHSLPEIGENFGGRDHTTVLHACRKVKLLREQDADIREDYMNLLRVLST